MKNALTAMTKGEESESQTSAHQATQEAAG
jgi:hypothetical protein